MVNLNSVKVKVEDSDIDVLQSADLRPSGLNPELRFCQVSMSGSSSVYHPFLNTFQSERKLANRFVFLFWIMGCYIWKIYFEIFECCLTLSPVVFTKSSAGRLWLWGRTSIGFHLWIFNIDASFSFWLWAHIILVLCQVVAPHSINQCDLTEHLMNGKRPWT